jgi:uncharacterized protein YigE (DUF2233 family)
MKILLLAIGVLFFCGMRSSDKEIVGYVVDLRKQDLQLYWKNDSGEILGNIQRLKDYLARGHKRLLFAMNGGMFKADHSPVGLFIQQQRMITPLDTASGEGNFYLKPNGVFYITMNNTAGICRTADFPGGAEIRWATQSGPMLVVDGQLHPAFREGSANVNIRNGVGLLPGNRLLFAVSKAPINFYDFASYFKEQGCSNALYLDGFVSRAYLPEKGYEQMDGSLGVLIASDVAQ